MAQTCARACVCGCVQVSSAFGSLPNTTQFMRVFNMSQSVAVLAYLNANRSAMFSVFDPADAVPKVRQCRGCRRLETCYLSCSGSLCLTLLSPFSCRCRCRCCCCLSLWDVCSALMRRHIRLLTVLLCCGHADCFGFSKRVTCLAAARCVLRCCRRFLAAAAAAAAAAASLCGMFVLLSCGGISDCTLCCCVVVTLCVLLSPPTPPLPPAPCLPIRSRS
jgi:hypothetical protein